MELEVYKVLQNKYKILKVISSNDYTTKYLVTNNEEEQFIMIELFPKELIKRENENIILINPDFDKSYLNLKKQFLEKATLIKKLDIKELPDITETFIENDISYVIYKIIREKNLTKFILEKEKRLDYKEVYEFLKPLYEVINTTTKNDIYFKIKSDNIMIDKNNNIKLFTNYVLEYNKNFVIKDLANIYYKLLTGVYFDETLKKPSEFGIIVPKDIENMLYEVLTSKIHFFSVEEFSKTLNDYINVANIQKDKERLKEKENIADKKTSFIIGLGCLFTTVFLILFILSVYYISVFAIKKISSFDITSRIENENPYEEDYYDYEYDYMEDLLFDYDLGSEERSRKGIVVETDENIFISSNTNEAVTLIKRSKDGKESKVILKDVIMHYMVAYKDYIYFSNFSDENKLYRVKTDGTGLEKIIDSEASYIQITSTGDSLYYVTFDAEEETYKIFKTNVDGTNNKLFLSSYDDNEFYYTWKCMMFSKKIM